MTEVIKDMNNLLTSMENSCNSKEKNGLSIYSLLRSFQKFFILNQQNYKVDEIHKTTLLILGVAGEAGEVLSILKIKDKTDKDTHNLGLELCDVLAYLAILAYDEKFTFANIYNGFPENLNLDLSENVFNLCELYKKSILFNIDIDPEKFFEISVNIIQSIFLIAVENDIDLFKSMFFCCEKNMKRVIKNTLQTQERND
ncbi:hypothetical protein NIES2100_05160 [Calothrix sp. NIES-2100]|uniref:hypothetical protein n=1 Tax=Calothrix sp. NIES-2100 TaxID=1954172 RepID=UPI000B61B0CA|nr:hypothetical protein NIES2100_05160 [Calothrix sp. NIES-2100]